MKPSETSACVNVSFKPIGLALRNNWPFTGATVIVNVNSESRDSSSLAASRLLPITAVSASSSVSPALVPIIGKSFVAVRMMVKTTPVNVVVPSEML